MVEQGFVGTAPSELPALRSPPPGSSRTSSRGPSRNGSRSGSSRRRAVRNSPQCQRWWDVDVTAGGLFDTTTLRPVDFVHKRPSTVPARLSQHRDQGLESLTGPVVTEEAVVAKIKDDAELVLAIYQGLENKNAADTERGPSKEPQSGQAQPEQKPAGFALATSTAKAPSTKKAEFLSTAWCGRCKAQPYCDCRRVVPSSSKHIKHKKSYNDVSKNLETVPERLPHWPGEVADVHLPPDPGPSAFSQRPHPRLPGLSVGDMARLDVQLLQFKVKKPALIKMWEEGDTDLSAMRLRLEADAVRMLMGKGAGSRNREELNVVLAFLQKCKFFRDLQETVLQELTQHLFLRTYDADTTLVRQGEKTQSILLILKGTVVKNEEASALMNTQYSAGYLLGFPEDPKLLDCSQPCVWEGLENSCTIVADTAGAVYGLSLSIDNLISALRAQSVIDRVDAMKLFVPTDERPPAEFSKVSRVFRDGQRVILYDLFSINTFPQKHCFFREGVEASKEAKVMMVISGEIALKMRDMVVKTVKDGQMMGQEPLSSMPYQFTAECASSKVRVLSISLVDYVTHFLKGRLPERVVKFSEPPTSNEVEVDANAPLELAGRTLTRQTASLRRVSLANSAAYRSIAAGHPFQNSISRDYLDALGESLVGPTRRHRDKCNLIESEWQTMQNKHSMSIAPAGLCPRSDRPTRKPVGCVNL